MNRDLRNFARIEFSRHECMAIKELHSYAVQVAPKHVQLFASDLDLSRKMSALRRATEALGAKLPGKNLQPVDLTQDECEAIDYLAEGFLQAMRENEVPGASVNQRLGNFAVVLSRVRMKCSAAALMTKPNVATDARLS